MSSRFSAAVAALPTGTIPVGLGLLVNGVSTYGFQILAFRMLGAEPYAALNGLWVTAFILAPGLFLPLEQEVARAVAHRRSLGQGVRPVLRKAAVLGVALIAGVVVVLVIARQPLEERLLRSSDGLFVALIVVLVGWGLMSVARGALSGNGRFGRYAVVVGVDGFARVALAAVLGALGVATLGWFGVVFAIAPFLAVIAGLLGARGLADDGPPASYSELTTAIGWLLAGSTLAQALGYSAYVGASLLATPSQNAALGAFIAGLFVARVPILLFQAVQAALLPRLAALLGRGKVREFRSGFLRLLVIVVVASGAAVLLAGTIGPAAGRILFGESFTLGAAALAALTAGCCLTVIGLTLAQALIALRRYALPALAWLAGFAAFLAVLVPTSGDVFARAEAAFVVGGLVAVAAMASAVGAALRRVAGDAVSSETAMGRPA